MYIHRERERYTYINLYLSIYVLFRCMRVCMPSAIAIRCWCITAITPTTMGGSGNEGGVWW